MTLPLRVHEYGSPAVPALVLLHGITDAGTTWPDAVDRWEADWHVLAVDQRGHGESPPFHETQRSRISAVLRTDAVHVLETTRELSGGEAAVVVGHSLGGRVALAVARIRPELVRALVLEDPALFWNPAEMPGFAERQEATLDLFADEEGRAAERERMRRESAWSEAEIEEWAACKPKVDRGFVRHLDVGGLDAVAALESLRVPTLVLVPPGTELVPDAAEVTNPLVRFAVIDGAGHCVRRDRPTEYYAAVEEFLAEVTAPQTR